MNDLVRRRIPTMEDIKAFQREASKVPQVDYPVAHYHSTGVYMREFRMPAGHFVIGKEHRTRHLNTLAKGRCTVWTVHEKLELSAENGPITWESMAGVKKVVLAHTDIVWLTVHVTDETDQDRLEFEIISPEEQESLFPELEQRYLGSK